jgi:hypothetical protein
MQLTLPFPPIELPAVSVVGLVSFKAAMHYASSCLVLGKKKTASASVLLYPPTPRFPLIEGFTVSPESIAYRVCDGNTRAA